MFFPWNPIAWTLLALTSAAVGLPVTRDVVLPPCQKAVNLLGTIRLRLCLQRISGHMYRCLVCPRGSLEFTACTPHTITVQLQRRQDMRLAVGREVVANGHRWSGNWPSQIHHTLGRGQHGLQSLYHRCQFCLVERPEQLETRNNGVHLMRKRRYHCVELCMD